MSNIIFPARELLAYSASQLKEILTGEFYLQFDDGVLFTNDRETNVTMPLWDFIRDHDIPLKKHHHTSFYMEKRMFHKNMHMDVLSAIFWDVYNQYKQFGRFGDYELLEKLTIELYEHSNKQYNVLGIWMEPYVVGTSITDVIEIFNIPEVKEILSKARPTEQSIVTTTYEMTKLLAKSSLKSIKNNVMVRMARAGIIKMNQLVQSYTPTGFIEDVDGSIFRHPLMSNYTDGHRSLHDNMVESCKASQAIEATKAELEEAVYQSRRQEILNEIIMNVHPGDCGTLGFIPVKLRRDNGLTESDLFLMSGKNYYEPGDKNEEIHEVMVDSEHLYDRVVHMRSILHCAHPDPNGVCETCLGNMSLTIPRRTNLGQIMTTDLYAFMIQLQLSKKHHLSNSVVQRLVIGDENKQYLKAGTDGVSYYFTEELKDKNFTLTISAAEGKTLADVMYLADVRGISITRLTEVGSMTLEIEQKSSYGAFSDRRSFIIGTGKRKASFSHEMLQYVKEQYWDIDERNNNFVIDMSKWDNDKPFAYVPMKNDSMADFGTAFKAHIESDVKQTEHRDTMIDPDVFLMETYDLLNSKLSVNMAQVEVAVFGIMIRSAKDGEYGTPKPWSKRGVGVMSTAMALRPLGAMMAFEKHTLVFNSVKSYIIKNRQDHPFEAILHPELVPEMKKHGFLP